MTSTDAVIFDFDGVIVDTERLHFDAFLDVFEPMGLGLSFEEYEEDYIGFDDRGAFRARFSQAGIDVDAARIDALCVEKGEAYLKRLLAAPPAPFPGFFDLLDQVAGLGPVAINTSAIRADIDPLLKQWDVEDRFAVITTADDVEFGKPDPAGYRLTVERLRNRFSQPIREERTLVFEDTPAGIQAALGAGLRVIGIGQSLPLEALHQAHDRVPDLLSLLGDGFAARVAGVLGEGA